MKRGWTAWAVRILVMLAVCCVLTPAQRARGWTDYPVVMLELDRYYIEIDKSAVNNTIPVSAKASGGSGRFEYRWYFRDGISSGKMISEGPKVDLASLDDLPLGHRVLECCVTDTSIGPSAKQFPARS